METAPNWSLHGPVSPHPDGRPPPRWELHERQPGTVGHERMNHRIEEREAVQGGR